MIQLDLPAIGRRIAFYRKLNDLTAAQLAELVGGGLTREVLAKIENGRRENLSLSYVVAIAWALGITPVALIVDIRRPLAPAEFTLPDGRRLTGQEVMAWFRGETTAGSGTSAATQAVEGSAMRLQMIAILEREFETLDEKLLESGEAADDALKERHREARSMLERMRMDAS